MRVINASLLSADFVNVKSVGVNSCLQSLVNHDSSFDLGCLVNLVCEKSAGLSTNYFVIMVFLPVLVYAVMRFGWWVDQQYFKTQGHYFFREIKFHGLNVMWVSYADFKEWCYDLALLFVSIFGVILLYFNGSFEFVRLWLGW